MLERIIHNIFRAINVPVKNTLTECSGILLDLFTRTVLLTVADMLLCANTEVRYVAFLFVGFLWNAVSFYQESSSLHYATLHAELSVDISFYFKTTAPSGVFLENLGVRDFIRVELSGEELS